MHDEINLISSDNLDENMRDDLITLLSVWKDDANNGHVKDLVSLFRFAHEFQGVDPVRYSFNTLMKSTNIHESIQSDKKQEIISNGLKKIYLFSSLTTVMNNNKDIWKESFLEKMGKTIRSYLLSNR